MNVKDPQKSPIKSIENYRIGGEPTATINGSLLGAFLLLFTLSLGDVNAAANPNSPFEVTVKPFFENHCVSCHGPDKEKGSLRVDQLVADLEDDYTLSHLQNIVDELTVQAMPPEEEPQPEAKEVVAVIQVLEQFIDVAKEHHKSGGGRPIRRLTRTEYINTVWDQLGVKVEGTDLPDDLYVGDFETNAEKLFMTDMHIRLYLDKAREVVRRFIASRNDKPGYYREEVPYSNSLQDSRFVFDLSLVPPAGSLNIRTHWWVRDPKNVNKVTVGEVDQLGSFLIKGVKSKPQYIDFKVWQPNRTMEWQVKTSKVPSENLNKGLNNAGAAKRMKTLYVDQVTDGNLVKVQGFAKKHPVVLGKMEYVRYVSSQPYNFFAPFLRSGDELSDVAARPIIQKFATLVKRGRPVDSQYVEKLYSVFKLGRKQGLPFWKAIEESFAISMCSIESMYHFENRDPSKKVRTVSALELASRLSYTLWRSAPDNELIKLGRSGELLDPEIKLAQVKRMVADDKFERFVSDFADQWFELPRQDVVAIETQIYSDFDVNVRPAMKQETIEFLLHMVKENLPVANLIDSDFMLLNEPLAKHYGIKGVVGDEFRVVQKRGTEADRYRGGILTHAGILMQGSTGDRTSIVERGAFVARKIINKPPGTPPPDAGELPVTGEDAAKMTGPELVKLHASSPQCANCHAKIDPLGVGLEEFDAVGLYRDKETRLNPIFDKLSKRQKRNNAFRTITVPLEVEGRIYGGRKFSGIQEMKKVLMNEKESLARGYIQALLQYINGREATLADEAIIDQLVNKTRNIDYLSTTILAQLLTSDIMTSY